MIVLRVVANNANGVSVGIHLSSPCEVKVTPT